MGFREALGLAAKRWLPKSVQRPIKRALEWRRDRQRAARVRALVKITAWEEPACLLCGGHAVLPHFVYNGFAIVRCAADGMIFASPRPRDTAPFYDQRYYQGEMLCGYPDYAGYAASAQRDWAERLVALEKTLGRRGRLLDVGCATGVFLVQVRDAGWQVGGVELSEFAARTARERHGLTVVQGSLPSGELASGSYDVVTLYDCIEHLADPAAVLRDVHRILAADGLVQLSTGAVPHLDVGRISRWYYPPWHLYYFAEPTMRALLENEHFEVLSYEERGDRPEESLMVVLARPVCAPASK
jgi:SAM-dependent methyltransferase